VTLQVGALPACESWFRVPNSLGFLSALDGLTNAFGPGRSFGPGSWKRNPFGRGDSHVAPRGHCRWCWILFTQAWGVQPREALDTGEPSARSGMYGHRSCTDS